MRGKNRAITRLTRATLETERWRRFGIVCLQLCVFWAATAIVARAQQDEQRSNDSVRFTTLINFDGTNGADPYYVSPVQGTDGNLYGTTSTEGANSGGTVFKMTPSGELTTLYNFCAQANCSDGSFPNGLVLGTDGDFYGTTQSGGANSSSCGFFCGTFFKLTPLGIVTTLYSFCAQANCTDGVGPSVPLVEGADGNFYGTTQAGGADGGGTVFKISRAGTLTTLHSFDGTDASFPSGLIQAADGNFYGTGYFGGVNGDGTVFKVSPAGTPTTLYSFCAQTNCTDGGGPGTALVQLADGDLYGTTTYGGVYSTCLGCGDGTVFKITLGGTLTTVYSFCAQTGCPDGRIPDEALIQATDGNLYGGTFMGGANGDGTLFKVTSSCTLTILHNFDGVHGEWAGGLVQATNGTLYGTTLFGGDSSCAGGLGCAIVYSLGRGTRTVRGNTAHLRQGRCADQSPGHRSDWRHQRQLQRRRGLFPSEIGLANFSTVPVVATTGFVTVSVGNTTLKSNVKFQVP